MRINQVLQEMGGVQSIARELGITEEEASSGAAALAPAVVSGFEQQAADQPASESGVEGLINRLGGAGLLDNVLAPERTDISRGNSLLGSIFGSKDVSRDVAQKASAESGVQPSVLKKMLPMLAMLVAGYIAKQRSRTAPTASGGGLGSILGGLFR